MGRPGTGLHPLRGQNNVQGARDAGLIPMMYPDYARVDDPAHRERFEEAWGVPLDPKPGQTVVEISHGDRGGDIRGDVRPGREPVPARTRTSARVRSALQNLDFLVVQDIFLTETAEVADVVLPATSYFEKTGTYTNTDRRVQLGREGRSMPPGEARLDWQILVEVMTRMGYPQHYADVEDVFVEFATLTQSYAGSATATCGSPGSSGPARTRRTGEGHGRSSSATASPTKSGRGRFAPAEVIPPARAARRPSTPSCSTPGRLLQHWHTGTMTRRAKVLDAIVPEAYCEMHPVDLARLGVEDGVVRRVSRRGATRSARAASPSREVRRRTCFIPSTSARRRRTC